MKPGQLVQLIMLGTIWGSSYLFVKVAVEGIDPVTLVAGRVALGAAILALIVWLRGIGFPRGQLLLHLGVMALVGNVVPFLLIAWGQQHISSGLASILNATTPFFTLVFVVWIFQSERLTLGRLVGLLLGFAGVAVLTGGELADLGASSTQGQIALLASSVCYGLAFAYARRFLTGAPLVLAASQLAISLGMLAPLVAVAGAPQSVELNLARAASWLALGTLSSGLAYLLYYRLIAEVGATAASFATYLMPIVGVLWGWLLLGERFGLDTFAGIALIFAGLAIATGMIRRARLSRFLERPPEPDSLQP